MANLLDVYNYRLYEKKGRWIVEKRARPYSPFMQRGEFEFWNSYATEKEAMTAINDDKKIPDYKYF